MSSKNNPGAYDCYANALPDEPIFTLLARDPVAPELVRRWASARSMTAGPDDFAKLNEARVCAGAMEIWRRENWPRRKGEAVEHYDLETDLWSIIDRNGLGDVPSDIVSAVSILVRHFEANDARQTELLQVIDREVNRRRAAEAALAEIKSKSESWLAAIAKLGDEYEMDPIGAGVLRAHVASLEAIIKLAGTVPPRCGDRVKHLPSGETWVVAYCEGNDLCAAGWPDSIARTVDCEITRRVTDEEHAKEVARWASENDRRSAVIARLYPIAAIAAEA